MKFLLLGAGGLLGRHLREELSFRGHEVVARTHEELDICCEDAARMAVESTRPDVVINAAAFCSFDGCEKNPALSREVNLEAPLHWSGLCAARGIHLVLFSSDYIFDGTRRHPYREEEPPSPLSVYGQHKAALESELFGVPTNLIFRPAWIFGLAGKTFMSLMPDLLTTNERLTVAGGKLGSCLHAVDGAKAVVHLAENGDVGLWNLVHPDATSWEEFATECREEMLRRGLEVRCRDISLRPFTELAGGSGQRPAYSVLDTGKLQATSAALPPWRAGLRAFLDRWQGRRTEEQNFPS